MADLLSGIVQDENVPLAERMRPRHVDEVIGQSHLLGPGKPLRVAFASGQPHSMILWGPPGVGKTTLARLMADAFALDFIAISAVLGGVKDIREAVDRAQATRAHSGKPTVVFVDEVHRFNKSQQDAFLPHVESGLFVFVGATTENPSFEVIGALLSRAAVYVLEPLGGDDLERLIDRALGEHLQHVTVDADARRMLIDAADGDARRLLNALEVAARAAAESGKTARNRSDAGAGDASRKGGGAGDATRKGGDAGARAGAGSARPPLQGAVTSIDAAFLRSVLPATLRRFDKGGENFYDQISALHKSVRGSDPDASLYWYARMLDGGVDPRYVARRAVRMAAEDIGLADPRALEIALAAAETYERLGSPEGELALAQALVYLAVAPKSNAVYVAFGAAQEFVRGDGSRPVPMHLRNAPTRLMKDLGYGKDYRYAHDEAGGYAAGEHYFPEGLAPLRWYRPTDHGVEARIAERLRQLRQLDARAEPGRTTDPGKAD